MESGTPEVNPFAPPRSDLEGGARDENEMALAGRGARLAASLIDATLAVGPLVGGGGLTFWNAERRMRGLHLFPEALLHILGVCWLLCIVLQAVLVSTRGQSLGKVWLRIKIVKTDGSRVGFVSGVLLRSWLMSATLLIPYVNVVIALLDSLLIFREDRRCLHDRIAGTKVVVLGERFERT